MATGSSPRQTAQRPGSPPSHITTSPLLTDALSNSLGLTSIVATSFEVERTPPDVDVAEVSRRMEPGPLLLVEHLAQRELSDLGDRDLGPVPLLLERNAKDTPVESLRPSLSGFKRGLGGVEAGEVLLDGGDDPLLLRPGRNRDPM